MDTSGKIITAFLVGLWVVAFVLGYLIFSAPFSNPELLSNPGYWFTAVVSAIALVVAIAGTVYEIKHFGEGPTGR